MAEPNHQSVLFILAEIEQTGARLAEISRSMHQTASTTQEVLAESRELIGRIERQLRQSNASSRPAQATG
jgi:hypothetical protein